MGIARLLAKGWVLFCLFAGGHAVRIALANGVPLANAAAAIAICVALFAAMGLLFVGGFGAAGSLPGGPLLARFRPRHLLPDFNEAVFLVFVTASFLFQLLSPLIQYQDWAAALQSAVYFLIPGQRALLDAMEGCSMDGGRALAAAFSWILALIYLASVCSRLKLQAGLIRLEGRAVLGPTVRAFLFGLAAVAGIQFLVMGSAYPWLDCSAFTDITGSLLIGLAPLMLSYLIVAALASLLASSPEA